MFKNKTCWYLFIYRGIGIQESMIVYHTHGGNLLCPQHMYTYICNTRYMCAAHVYMSALSATRAYMSATRVYMNHESVATTHQACTSICACPLQFYYFPKRIAHRGKGYKEHASIFILSVLTCARIKRSACCTISLFLAASTHPLTACHVTHLSQCLLHSTHAYNHGTTKQTVQGPAARMNTIRMPHTQRTTQAYTPHEHMECTRG
jgi:hypothetical protein